MSAIDDNKSPRGGVALLLTLVILVIIATLAYTITSTAAVFRHRAAFVVDQARAVYARDSAAKFAVALAADLDLALISRPNEPDFSDLFHMSDEQIEQLVRDYLRQYGAGGLLAAPEANDEGEPNQQDQFAGYGPAVTAGDLAQMVPGPYGAAWPMVTEPTELEIGPVTVTIRIEDENAKYPALWLLMDDQRLARPIQAGFGTLCEWMDYPSSRIESIMEQFAAVAKIKPYRPAAATVRGTTTSRQVAPRLRQGPGVQAVTPQQQSLMEILKLLHSPMLDRDLLAGPAHAGGRDRQSLARYLGLWGTDQVNVNTAPRHVLEATFALVGNAAAIADAVIQQRRIQPFTDLADMRKRLTTYADALERCSQYITFASTTLSIHITARCGLAKSETVLGVTKSGNAVTILGLVRS